MPGMILLAECDPYLISAGMIQLDLGARVVGLR